MKTISFLMLGFLLFTTTASADTSSKIDRLIFERVSFDNGETWEPALCKHVTLGKKGINCEAGIPANTRHYQNGDQDSYRIEVHSNHRFKSTRVTESGDSINEVLEFSGNVIKQNGRIVALMDEGITSVSLYTPEMKVFIVLHAGEAEKNSPLEVINEIASSVSQITSPALDIQAFPNPLTGNTLNLKSNTQVFKTVIYDSTGRPLITDHEIWNTRRSISMEGVPPGSYIIECYSGEPGTSTSSMTKILRH